MTKYLGFTHSEPQLLLGDLSESINWISKVAESLSILGSIFNIVVTLWLGKSKFIIGKMVITLAIFDLITHIPLVLTAYESLNNPFSCEIAGSWFSYFGYTSSFFFTTCFAHSLYYSLKKSIDFIEAFFKRYVMLSVISGLIVGSFSVILRFKEYVEYPDGHSLCRIRYVYTFDWGILFILLIPGTINIIGCISYYIITIKLLRALNEKVYWGLLVYPLILVVCISPFLVQRFLGLIGWRGIYDNGFFFQITRGLFGSQGFFNSLAYGLSREIYQALRSCCCPSRAKEMLMESVSSAEDEVQLGGQRQEGQKSVLL